MEITIDISSWVVNTFGFLSLLTLTFTCIVFGVSLYDEAKVRLPKIYEYIKSKFSKSKEK